MPRIEEDFIGKVEVPDRAYYGGFTVRASKAFQLSGQKVRPELIRAIALIKKSSAQANKDLGKLDGKVANAIIQSAEEVLAGRFDEEFILDAYQAGAGTPLHMNVNEVIANRAIEILGGKKGEYSLVNPNNHVNMSQSSNDVTPTAVRLACILYSKNLLKEMQSLEKILDKKAEQYSGCLACGRTHLQDAVPISYGQVFASYSNSLKRDRKLLEFTLDCLFDLGIGGTAVGTGITAHPKFKEKILYYIRKNTGVEVRTTEDSVEATSNMNSFLGFSAAFRSYATTLNRIANDLRLLVSGPKTAIAEIVLPEIEPGSSIMPGKVNPSIPEAVNQACFQVLGNDRAIELAANSGQLQLNFFTPLIGQNLLISIELLTNSSRILNDLCIAGLRVNEKRVKENLEASFAFATALNPYLGYSVVSKLVTEAYARGTTLRQIILEKKLISEKDLDKILSPQLAAGPSEIDKGILDRIRKK